MNYGPRPWVQQHWDWRAAANFVCGGAGAGLVAFTGLAALATGAAGAAVALPLVAGFALVGVGLGCVALELGRPLRALNVFRNPRTSWMSREAITATLLAAATLAAAWLFGTGAGTPSAGAAAAAGLAAALALGFVWCQARMVHAARGIPAWRSPATPPLMVATALTEGAGLWWLAAPWHGHGTRVALACFGVLVVARLFAWLAHRRSIAAHRRAAAALAPAGLALAVFGTLVPLALIAVAIALPDRAWVDRTAALAGAFAVAAGAGFKLALFLRGSFNQGFAVAHMPVRGTRPWPDGRRVG
jgi:phenylacetyl-CoA:acceptor oxidoreductase subunit 2